MEVTALKAILKEGSKNGKLISQAKRQQERIRFHSQVTVEHESNQAATDFLRLVKSLIPESYKMFLSLFRAPVATVPFTSQINTVLAKIWDGRNPYHNTEFKAEELKADYQDYRLNTVQLEKRMRTEGLEVVQNSINSLVVVDLPMEQVDSRPAPYFYFLDLNHIIDFETIDGTMFRWVAFRQEDDKAAVFCTEYYRTFKLEGGKIEGEPLTEVAHGLGFCPVRTCLTTPLTYRQPFIKKSPLSSYLGALDMLLFFEVSKDHLNTYARYPVYSVFSQDCDYQTEGDNEQLGSYCKDGYLMNDSDFYLMSGGALVGCPKCSGKPLGGAGTVIEIDPPSAENENVDLRNPINVHGIDRDSLDYNNEDIALRKSEILAQVTGYGGAMSSNKAINKEQVKGVFEGLETALKMPQQDMEQLIEFIDDTICRLRYGSDYIGTHTSLGTEHYIMGASDILEMYQKAKSVNSSMQVLDMLEDLYYETEYKNNASALNRQRILTALDPFRHRTAKEVETLLSKSLITNEQYLLKVNFSTLVMRFERENIPVTQFASLLSFDKKVENIKAALLVYAKEMQPVIEVVIDPIPQPQPI